MVKTTSTYKNSWKKIFAEKFSIGTRKGYLLRIYSIIMGIPRRKREYWRDGRSFSHQPISQNSSCCQAFILLLTHQFLLRTPPLELPTSQCQNLCAHQRRTHNKFYEYHPFVIFTYLHTFIPIPKSFISRPKTNLFFLSFSHIPLLCPVPLLIFDRTVLICLRLRF